LKNRVAEGVENSTVGWKLPYEHHDLLDTGAYDGCRDHSDANMFGTGAFGQPSNKEGQVGRINEDVIGAKTARPGMPGEEFVPHLPSTSPFTHNPSQVPSPMVQ
jgi:hypothetical protein